MRSRHALIAPHVQAFFAEHLCHHKRVSPQTITSDRDAFRLLLTFVKEAAIPATHLVASLFILTKHSVGG